MKQKLTLFVLALLCSIGMWAATPSESAYPKIGRTYYITVNNGTTKWYIYNDAGTLKSTTTAPYEMQRYKKTCSE